MFLFTMLANLLKVISERFKFEFHCYKGNFTECFRTFKVLTVIQLF